MKNICLFFSLFFICLFCIIASFPSKEKATRIKQIKEINSWIYKNEDEIIELLFKKDTILKIYDHLNFLCSNFERNKESFLNQINFWMSNRLFIRKVYDSEIKEKYIFLCIIILYSRPLKSKTIDIVENFYNEIRTPENLDKIYDKEYEFIFKKCIYYSNTCQSRDLSIKYKLKELKKQKKFAKFISKLKFKIDERLPDKIRKVHYPAMYPKEIRAFFVFMKKENIYFEFGSGGTTLIATHYGLKAYAVESNPKFAKKVIKEGAKINYIIKDLQVDETGWGYPGNNTNLNDWKKYFQAYKKEYNADIIHIDGRFKVACAFDIFNKIRDDTIIFIHDYFRIQYHIIEDYYDRIYSWNTYACFLKKKNVKNISMTLQKKYWYEKI